MFKTKKKKEELISFESETTKEADEQNPELKEKVTSNKDKKVKKKKEKKPKKEKKIKLDKNGEPKKPFFKNKKSVGILLIVLSLLAMVSIPIINYFLGLSSVTVYVAKEDLPSSAVAITDDMITSFNIKKGSMLPVYITEKDNIVGSYVKSDFAKGEIISSPKISKMIPFYNNYLYDLQGKKAMTVTTKNLSTSLGGKLQSGDIVSVYFFDENKAKETSSYNGDLAPELTYVKVLAVTNSEGEDIEDSNKDSLEEPLPSCVTLLVDNIQSKALVGLEENYTIHFALVNRGNEENSAKLLDMQNDINKGGTAVNG